MSKQDVGFKDFFENRSYFVDMFNAYFFNGKPVLKEEYIQDMNSEMNDVLMDLTKHVDVIRKYHDGKILSVFILENQSRVDYAMVIRAMYYEALAYDRLLNQKRKNKELNTNTKFPMVYVLVFYTGEQVWTAPRKLSEIVEVDEEMKAYFHDYQLNIVEIQSNTNYNFSEKDVHDLVYLTRAIYNQSVHEEGILKSFGKVKRTIVELIDKITDVKWLKSEAYDKKETIDMCEAERAWEESKIQQGITQGIALGRNEGITEGIELGKNQGIAQGKQDEKKSTYKTMLSKGFSMEQIADIFSVQIESVKEMVE